MGTDNKRKARKNLANQQKIFNQYRPRLQAIAYRMLGTIGDAEDMVQETFIKWLSVSVEEIQSPQAYLTTIVTRLCIDYLRSSKVRHEQYVGVWLPEPIVSHFSNEPSELVELADSLAMAFLVILERLSPVERAVFLLREVFEYDYDEISRHVGKNGANCRQIFRRAKQHIEVNRSRFDTSLSQQEQLTRKFIEACEQGDLPGLIDLLAADITLWSDGGGKVQSLLKPMQGGTKVARFLIALRRSKLIPNYDSELVRVNGQIGIIYSLKGSVQNVVTFEFIACRIRSIYFVRNPDKLRRISDSFSSDIDSSS
ncbi:MAG: RNA polymerase sigma-70 factor [Richelia sp. RM2_1_2]|nr:RNA polymerase sigma-70 factor [Richelia sp. SM2_1_7]NJM22403.1 RNA polymerase sigma-70 factor [Richelia sp. SM1_7_0]NJN12422.1 RNA polymerase sigma-70 factor [Richelia sp. RM1_1_1]NJO30155.1 RNA polymerase sigma-70 factor [Richelia sp. SL_2_1]NJO63705.1 RNA polymerase sigma-70 factor [Richelia sp. RM2_1_2]